MKTYAFNEVFNEATPIIAEGELLVAIQGRICPLSKEQITEGDEVTRVLIPDMDRFNGMETRYNDVIIKTKALKAANFRFFKGAVPRVASPKELD